MNYIYRVDNIKLFFYIENQLILKPNQCLQEEKNIRNCQKMYLRLEDHQLLLVANNLMTCQWNK